MNFVAESLGTKRTLGYVSHGGDRGGNKWPFCQIMVHHKAVWSAPWRRQWTQVVSWSEWWFNLVIKVEKWWILSRSPIWTCIHLLPQKSWNSARSNLERVEYGSWPHRTLCATNQKTTRTANGLFGCRLILQDSFSSLASFWPSGFLSKLWGCFVFVVLPMFTDVQESAIWI